MTMKSAIYETDVIILTVTDKEYNAVKYFCEWKELKLEGDEQLYEVSYFKREGKEYRAILVKVPEMGMTASATVTMKIICSFHPRYIIMVGIAAGVALKEVTEQLYGDVVAANTVWNYANGKFVSPDRAYITFGDVGFIPRSTKASIPEWVIPYIRAAAESEENQCHVVIGPMACGSTVVANKNVLEKQIHTQFRDTIGLDMESYAVVYASLHAPEPRPTPIILKSVCDYGNAEKSDDFQRFAAYTSFEFAKLLYEKFLPM